MSYREPLHRRKLLKILLVLTSVSGVVFFAINSLRGLYPLALVELMAALYSLALYPVVARTQHLNGWILAYLLPFMTIMMFALAQPAASSTVFVWVFLIPQVCYSLTGVSRGFALSGFYLLCAAAIFFYRFFGTGLVQPVAVANMVICAIAIWSFAHHYEYARERFSSRLLRLAERDSHTGLLNRMRLAELVESEIANAQARGQTAAMILLDLDFFKQINDAWGHPVGDEALLHAADLLQRHVRKTDYVFRVGGEEFCLLLPGAGLLAARDVAESVRKAFEQDTFHVGGRQIPFTASLGVAVSGADGMNMIDLYHAADQRLYAAKYAGRNRVVADDRVSAMAADFALLP